MSMDQIELPAGCTVADARQPDWKAGGRVHNWRTHVPEEARQCWPMLPYWVRFLLVRWADQLAEQEEWD